MGSAATVWSCLGQGWQPGIGDPGLTGWLTVAAYLASCALAWRVAARRPRVAGRGFWLLLVALMGFLALNKQLDLQTALTATGRCMAHAQGWYENRAQVQLAFIAGLVALAVLVVGGLALTLRGSLRQNGLALAGLVVVSAFVLVRAVGFHHVDLLINRDFGGVRSNFLFETAGLALIALNALILLKPRGRAVRPR
ncbi:hypothetical protein [Paracoccus luteus]|uniref:hypothetical protein n=1 Tax=Paracoccus luteus TaxID=2508543 RepID=UPI00107039FD|nr:hypothetical protein [Paracoccus luteus]